jgi:hypothetical protein
MVSQVEVALDTINIYLISDIIDLISSDSLKDKRFKFSDQQILTIMVLKEINCWTPYILLINSKFCSVRYKNSSRGGDLT